jgi:hypothetical protein
VCLIAGINVRLRRTLSACGRLPQAALAGLLALLLLAAATFSVSHALHQSLHGDSAADSHFCFLCSLAKGQVTVATVAVLPAALVLSCLWSFRPLSTSPLPGFDYCLSRSRAPPSR